MKKYSVKEGSTGVLELVDERGIKEIYQPDCDLDKAQKLLYEFYELETATGKKVKDTFQKDGTDWFPTSISLLYWQFFYQIVKYRPLVKVYLDGDVQFKFESPGRFSNLIKTINDSHSKNTGHVEAVLRTIYHRAIQLRNRLVTNKRGDILFFSYGIDDFRTDELLHPLQESYEVTRMTNIPVKHITRHLLDPKIYILTAVLPELHFEIAMPDNTPPIFKAALCYVQSIINSHLSGYKSHLRQVRNLKYRLFFGIDDANFVYPLIYAAQDKGIRTLGFQHGAYSRREESYFLHGLERYRWYDNVLVWGEYWKNVVLKHSNLFSDTYHIPASNKHSYDYTILPKKGRERVILVPYEFLADSIKIGQYIRGFIAKGFKIYFKPRPDEAILNQIEAYYLGDCRKDIEIIEIITPEVMAEVDVIAGTQTALLFDLLPYNKPVWILETSFRLMYDMVEDGFARILKEEDMARINEIYMEGIGRKRTFDLFSIYGSKPVKEAVEEYLTAGESAI